MNEMSESYLHNLSDKKIAMHRKGILVGVLIIMISLWIYTVNQSLDEALVPFTYIGLCLFVLLISNDVRNYIHQKKARKGLDDLQNHPYINAIREEFKPKTCKEKLAEREEAEKKAVEKSTKEHVMMLVPEEWIGSNAYAMIKQKKKEDPKFAENRIIKVSGYMVSEYHRFRHDDIIELIDFKQAEKENNEKL